MPKPARITRRNDTLTKKNTDIATLRQLEYLIDLQTENARDKARRMLAAELRAEADTFVA